MSANLKTDYRIIYLDIDGTLVGKEGKMSDRVRDSVRRAISSGRVVVLATGRSFSHTLKIAIELGGMKFGILLNGGTIVDWVTGEVLRSVTIPLDIAVECVKTCHESFLAPVWFANFEGEEIVSTDRVRPLWSPYEAHNSYRLKFHSDLAIEMTFPPESLAAYGSELQIQQLAQTLTVILDGKANVTTAPTEFYGGWYAQVTAFEADKSTAAAWIANSLKIPREATLAIGDQSNDLALLRWAGMGICMGDGSPEAISVANETTGTLAEDGVAQALEKYLFNSRF